VRDNVWTLPKCLAGNLCNKVGESGRDPKSLLANIDHVPKGIRETFEAQWGDKTRTPKTSKETFKVFWGNKVGTPNVLNETFASHWGHQAGTPEVCKEHIKHSGQVPKCLL